ncbi:MAG: SH3 domain-containing protein [Anaerolineae bacterium]|nr:SH3 domain-containing protein [Anaerolineae bacterium]
MKSRPHHLIGVMLLVLGLLLPVSLVLGQGGDETASVISRAPLHAGPSAPSETIAMLPRGTLLFVKGMDESLKWVEGETTDGLTGWVHVDHLRLNGPYIPPADGFTGTAIDGRPDDWDRFLRPYTDETGDSAGAVDITAVRSFLNDQYLYVLVEVQGDPADVDLLLLDIVTNNQGVYSTYQYALPRLRAGTVFVISPDAAQARAAAGVVTARDIALELRMPLTLLDNPPALNLVAVRIEEGETVTDELAAVMPAVVTVETEPPLNGAIANFRVNFRAAPRDGRVITVLDPGTMFSLRGRTADGEWLLVRREDASQGWVAAQYVQTELDINALPVVE